MPLLINYSFLLSREQKYGNIMTPAFFLNAAREYFPQWFKEAVDMNKNMPNLSYWDNDCDQDTLTADAMPLNEVLAVYTSN